MDVLPRLPHPSSSYHPTVPDREDTGPSDYPAAYDERSLYSSSAGYGYGYGAKSTPYESPPPPPPPPPPIMSYLKPYYTSDGRTAYENRPAVVTYNTEPKLVASPAYSQPEKRPLPMIVYHAPPASSHNLAEQEQTASQPIYRPTLDLPYKHP